MDPKRWKSLLETANVILHGWSVQSRNYVLDPLTCLMRLAMISFLPDGTKISINQNRVTYSNAGFFQGPVRWVTGDTRDDLHNLHNPIQKIGLWYYIKDPAFQYILRKGILGLTKVKNSYSQQSIIRHSLDHYIGILEKSVIRESEQGSLKNLSSSMMINFTDVQNKEKLEKEHLERDRSEKKVGKNKQRKGKGSGGGGGSGSAGGGYDDDEEVDIDDNGDEEGKKSDKEKNDNDKETNLRESLLYRSFQDLWNYRQMMTIYYLYQELDRTDLDQTEKDGIIQATELLLDLKEKKVTEFILKMTTVL